MGKFERLVKSKEGVEKFRAKYRIPPKVVVYLPYNNSKRKLVCTRIRQRLLISDR